MFLDAFQVIKSSDTFSWHLRQNSRTKLKLLYRYFLFLKMGSWRLTGFFFLFLFFFYSETAVRGQIEIPSKGLVFCFVFLNFEGGAFSLFVL